MNEETFKIIDHPAREFPGSYAIVSDKGGIFGGIRMFFEHYETYYFSCLSRFKTKKEAKIFLSGEW